MPSLNTVRYVNGYGIPNTVAQGRIQLDSIDSVRDSYVVKYNTSGKAQWAARITTIGADGFETAYGIETDSSENVYVVGSANGPTILIYNANGTSFGVLSMRNTSGVEAFIIKYGPNGVAQWAAGLSGAGRDVGYATSLDSSGNIYVTGFYTGTLIAYNSDKSAFATTLANAGGSDIFIAKYNSSGFVQWVTRISGTGTGSPSDTGYDISTDSDGNVCVSGVYEGIATIYNANGSTFGTLANAAGTGATLDTFLVKYNTNGVAQWTARVAYANNDLGFAVTTDSSGNVYVGGLGSGGASVVLTAYNSDTTAFSRTVGNSGSGDGFLVKYNSTGFVQWVVSIVSGGADNIYDLKIDPSGDLYVCGNTSTANGSILNSDGTIFGTIASLGGFLVKYNTNGMAQWSARTGNTSTAFSLDIDSSGNVYMTGLTNTAGTTSSFSIFNSTAAGGGLFSTLQTATETTGAAGDSFLVKYNSSGAVQWATKITSLGLDFGRGIAVDSNGNVYTCGLFTGERISVYGQALSLFTTLANSGNKDAFVAKYNRNGGPQWAARIASANVDEAYGTTTDSDGNVYVVGSVLTAGATIFNADGTTFGSIPNAGGYDTFLVKYNSSGFAQWFARIASAGNDFGYSICVDSSSNIIITGTHANTATILNSDGTTFGTLAHSGLGDAFLVKYNSSGFAQWATRIAATGFDSGYGVACDSSGNINVTGAYIGAATVFSSDGSTFGTLTNSGTTSDSFLVSYTPSGTTRWATRIASTSTDSGRAVACDSSGNIYAVGQYSGGVTATIFNSDGTSFGTLTHYNGGDGYIVKYNSSGTALWTIPITASGADSVNAVAVDTAGNVYVTGSMVSTSIGNADGTTFRSLAGVGGNDTFLVKYNSSGFGQWATRIASTASDIGYGIATDSAGRVYVSGMFGGTNLRVTAFNSDGSEFAAANGSLYGVIQYDTNGVGQWFQYIRGLDQARGVAVSPVGDCYVTGHSASGNPLAFYNMDRTPYLTINSVKGTDIFIVKQSSSATPLWTAILSSTDSAEVARSIVTDSSGNLYVAGNSGNGAATLTVYNADRTVFGQLTPTGRCGFLVKYNPDGTVAWASRGIDGGANIVNAVTVDSSGDVYVTGEFTGTSTIYNANGTTFGTLTVGTAGATDTFLVKYNSSGTAQWSVRISISSLNCRANAVATDSTGNVFILGQYSGVTLTVRNSDGTTFGTLSNVGAAGSADVFLIEYNSSGFVQWDARITGTSNSDDIGWRICTDSSGNVYVAGQYFGTLFVRNANDTPFGSLAALGLGDTFLAKYNSSGTVQWITRFGSTTVLDRPYGVVADSGGNVYMAAQFGGTTTIYQAGGTTTFGTLTAGGTLDTCVIKYNTNGEVQWASRIACLGGTSISSGIALDSSGSVYLYGSGNAIVSVYNTDGTFFGSLAVRLTDAAFVVKYDSSGVVQWVSNMSGDGNQSAQSISVDPSGNIYTTGTFTASALIPYDV